MRTTIGEILKLEDDEQFQAALENYRHIYMSDSNNFETWKHYYFFLWYVVVEAGPLGIDDFVQSNNLAKELKSIGSVGYKKYTSEPEAQFLLGYTIGLFPYYFGDYEEWENKGKGMLKIAADLDPEDNVYRMVVLGQQVDWETNEEYKKACITAAQEVKLRFKGEGLLNSYFREVLDR